MNIKHISFTLISSLLLSGCSMVSFFGPQDGPPKKPVDLSQVKNATPLPEPESKYGNQAHYCVLDQCYDVLPTSKGFVATGMASWYGTKFNHQLTSNGERYDMLKMTAANKTLPLPTYVRVTNLGNGRRVIVRVNDRGPFEKNRLIDLSYAAADKLGILPTGTAFVRVEALDPTKKYAANTLPIVTQKQLHYVQVAAFSVKDHAVALQQKLIAENHKSAKIVTAELNGKPLYKVYEA